jgi:hypothetical protein
MAALLAVQIGKDPKDKILFEAEPVSRGNRVGDPNRTGEVTRRGVADVIQDASQSLEHAMELLSPAAQMIVEKLKSAAPSEVAVEFGVKLQAEAGIVITKAGSEAHFQITMKWKSAKSSK